MCIFIKSPAMLLCGFLCVFLPAAFAQYAQVIPNNVQVNTTQGIVQGVANGSYLEFYGIHYGGYVSGDNRFKAPPPAPTYPGIFHAIDKNIICAQPSQSGLIGVEDCLTLNVFTNSTTPGKPVLVWLTGEEYTRSDQEKYTRPDQVLRSFQNFVQHGIVVVQVNYRLSIFGFLCLGVKEAPGNAGLKDVVQALKWVQQNIEGFGGDANNVALFGHGSGAAMADLITMSPLAQNLVHKVIAQSGSALAPWAISYDPIGYAHALGNKLGYDGQSNEELAKHFINTDASLLMTELSDFQFLNNSVLFAPCIENANLNPNDTFLADAPLNLLRAGNYIKIPYIAGYTDREGTMRVGEAAHGGWLEKMQANFSNFVPVDLDFGSNATAVEKSIREYYFAQRNINMETIEDYLDYQGDTLVLVSVIRGARERALTSSAPVRLYEFEYKGTLNSDFFFSNIPLTGARHGVIINYLLNHDLKQIDQGVMNSLVRRYVGFLNNGVPSQSVNPGAEWPPITSSLLNYLLYSGGETSVINNSVFSETARVNPHSQRMGFWNDLYEKYYRPPKPVSSGTTCRIMLAVLLAPFFVMSF